MEAGVVIAGGKPVFWHLPAGRTMGSLPDSRSLWDVLWEHRETLDGFAHSHPGSGVPGPSHTDVTTFKAVEQALGKKLRWWITSKDAMVVCSREAVVIDGPAYSVFHIRKENEPDWVYKLREHSYVPEPERPRPVELYEP